MPNYVINTITLIGSQNDIVAVCELLQNKNVGSNEEIDFNNVVPMPKSVDIAESTFASKYIAVYVRTLPEDEKMQLAQELLKHSDGFYKSYYYKYIDAFTKEITNDDLARMQESFKKDYESINPATIEDVGKTYIDNILNYGADTWFEWSCKNWGTKWGAMNSYFVGNCIGFQTAWSAALPITIKLSELFPDEDMGSKCGRYKIKMGETLEEYLPKGEEAVLFACNMWGNDPTEYGVETANYMDDDVDSMFQDAMTQCETVLSSKV